MSQVGGHQLSLMGLLVLLAAGGCLIGAGLSGETGSGYLWIKDLVEPQKRAISCVCFNFYNFVIEL